MSSFDVLLMSNRTVLIISFQNNSINLVLECVHCILIFLVLMLKCFREIFFVI